MKRIFTFLFIAVVLVIGTNNTMAQCVDTIKEYETKLAGEGGSYIFDTLGGDNYFSGQRLLGTGEAFLGLNGAKAHGLRFEGQAINGNVDVEVAVYEANAGQMGGVGAVGAKLGFVTVTMGTTLQSYEGIFPTPIDITGKACLFAVEMGASETDSVLIKRVDGGGAYHKDMYEGGGYPSMGGYDNMVSILPIVEYEVGPAFTSNVTDICPGDFVGFTYTNKPSWGMMFNPDVRAYMLSSNLNVNSSSNAFEWDFADGSPLDNSSTTPTHVFANEGTYQVTLTENFDGYTTTCIESANITINVLGNPVADFNLPDNSSLTVNLTSNSTDASSWDWDFGDGNTSTDENPTHTYAANGSYVISLTVDNACGNGSNVVTKTMVFSVGMEDMEIRGNVGIYPNPVKEELNFNFKGGLENEAIVEVYNILGTKVAVETIQTGTTTYSIETVNLQSGKYLLRFVNKDIQFTKPFVKM